MPGQDVVKHLICQMHAAEKLSNDWEHHSSSHPGEFQAVLLCVFKSLKKTVLFQCDIHDVTKFWPALLNRTAVICVVVSVWLGINSS